MTEQRTTESMEQRVERLLTQAEDFRRHGEDGSADAAMAIAEKIMLKHSIDQSVIATRLAAGQQPDNDVIITYIMPFKGIYRKALVPQFARLVRSYTDTIKVFISSIGNVENLHVVGFQSEVEHLKLLITSLHLQVIASINVWWKSSPLRGQLSGMPAYKARRQYASSWIQGATDRIARARRDAVREATDTDPGTALALRTRENEVDAYMAANYRLSTRRTNMSGGGSVAANAGYAAGQRANTGERPVGSGRRQIGT